MYAYIDAHFQIVIDEDLGDVLQSITILQYQFVNMTFSDQIRYNRLFQKVIHKVVKSSINYINKFQNAKDLEISVINSYSEYQLMHTLLEIFQQGGK